MKRTVLTHWKDEMNKFNQKTVAVSLLMFITVIAPTLTFLELSTRPTWTIALERSNVSWPLAGRAVSRLVVTIAGNDFRQDLSLTCISSEPLASFDTPRLVCFLWWHADCDRGVSFRWSHRLS